MKTKTLGLVGEIRKNTTEMLRVSAIEFNNHELFDVRAWYITTDGTYMPSKKGITIQPALLPGLIRLLQSAHQGHSVTRAKQEQI